MNQLLKRHLLFTALAFAAGLIGGYFIGRAHLKHEMKTALTAAVAGFGEGIKEAFSQSGKHSPLDSEKLKGAPAAGAQDVKLKQEKLDYIREHLEVYEIKAEFRQTVFGNEPVVSGKIKNKGDRTLKKVEITAYFLDSNRNVIFENSYHPVLDSSYGDKTPLKPNYIQPFAYRCEKVPSEWAEGQVRVSVTQVQFEDASHTE